MPQQPQAFDPNEFANSSAQTFDPNEFAKPAATPESSWFDTVASYIPQPVKSAWNSVWEPMSDLPSRAMKPISEAEYKYGESGSGLLNKLAMYGGAFDESVGNVLSGMTSPGVIGTTLATGGANLLEGSTLPVLPELMSGASRLGGGLTAAHGATQVADPNASMLQRGMGALEAVGGGLAARGARPSVATRVPEELPVKPPIAKALEGTSEQLPVKPPRVREQVPQTIPYEPPSVKNASNVARQEAALADLEGRGMAKPEQPFDASTLQFAEETPKPQVEFVDPATGEIKSAAEAKPGDVPLVPNEARGSTLPPETATVNEAPAPKLTAQSPFADIEARMYELTDKGTAGTLTADELQEAQALNKIWRNHPEFNKPTQTPGEYLDGKPQVSTGPLEPANAGVSSTAQEVTQKLSDRLKKVTEHPETASDEVKSTVKDAEEIIKNADEQDKPGLVRKALGVNKALLTSWDLSAPGRQGKAFITNKAWWTSLDDMVKAWGSKRAADLVNQSIVEHPSGYFKPGLEGGKSFAERMGLELTPHEEMFNTTAGKAVNKYLGIDKANRAHTAFLNKLRSDQFVSMMEAAKKAELNPALEQVRAKAYAKFINDATGRGSLNFGKYKLERNMNALNDVFFAPKNMSGQIRTWNAVLNPIKYANYDPVMRQQALRSLFAIAGTGLAVSEMAKMAGAQVTHDPTSSDFLKIKIGNSRIDPFGGYQQFPVAAMKFMLGSSTSTITGKTTDLTAGKFGQSTRGDVAERFFTNRLSPAASFVWAWMHNKEFDGKPFEVKRALFERVFPIAAKDIIDLAKEDPALAFVTAPSTMLGLTGTQTYTGR